jgi:hypothetical protein
MTKEKTISFPLFPLFIIFLILKLTKTVDWSWGIITLPLWLGIALLIAIPVVLLIIAGFCYLGVVIHTLFERKLK